MPTASIDALGVAELIDQAVERRVLVFGAPPGVGRDLDLLARPAEHAAIASALKREGFVQRAAAWAAFGAGTAYAVELVHADNWALPPVAVDALFEEASPVHGLTFVVRPAPHHRLLVLARRLVWAGGRLDDKLRVRADEALAEDPRAWEAAAEHARAWRTREALRLLRQAHRSGRATYALRLRATAEQQAWRASVPRVRRPLVVALSGLDGAGKSTQASHLRDALDRLGVETEVVWSPLGGNPTLELIGMPLKRLLRRLRFGPFAALAERSASGHVMSKPGADPPRGALRGLMVGWASLVVGLNLLSQRRAVAAQALKGRRVVVFDRHALDSLVRLRFLYGAAGSAAFQKGLVAALAPRARLAYLLEVRPDTALARKPDEWSLDQLRRQAALYHEEGDALGVRRLEGEREPEGLAAEIAREVWLMLG
jgi:thymidylate kinase